MVARAASERVSEPAWFVLLTGLAGADSGRQGARSLHKGAARHGAAAAVRQQGAGAAAAGAAAAGAAGAVRPRENNTRCAKPGPWSFLTDVGADAAADIRIDGEALVLVSSSFSPSL
jgi:hypothetical protein